MTNWLESEEDKNSNRLRQEELIHKNLKRFYDLCDRVNNVRTLSLEVLPFEIISKKDLLLYHKVRGSAEDISYINRCLRVYYVEPNCFYIDLFIKQIIHNNSMYDGNSYTQNETILFTKKIDNEDIINWHETSILNIIQWLILENDSAKENLPGLMDTSVIFDIKSSLAINLKNLNKDLRLAQITLNEIDGWKFGRSSFEKKAQLDAQNTRIYCIKEEIKDVEIFLNKCLY